MTTFKATWKEAASDAKRLGGQQMAFDPNWMSKLPKAEYCKGIPQFMLGSPTVEALGPILEMEDIFRQVRFSPKYDRQRDTTLPRAHRLHHLPLMWEIVEPLPAHYALANAISINVRHRQLKQCPFRQRRSRLLHELPDSGIKVTECTNRLMSPAPAILVCGPSGYGKNVLIESCLGALFPYQACRHEKYTDGRRVDIAQAIWSKVDCSFDASVTGIAYGLFAGLDSALGTNYLGEFCKRGFTNDSLLIHWQRLVAKHCLGVLWVDEVQCLESAGKKILNFFLKVSNLLGVTIIFSGTNAAAKLFSVRLHNARRICSAGMIELELYRDCNDEIWTLFMRTLYRYQWVQNPIRWDRGIADKVFFLTCGVHALAVLLWMLVQKVAIESKVEAITVDGLQKVYDQQFRPLHPCLDALRSKRRDRLNKYEDMLPAKDVLENFMREAVGDEMERARAYLRAKRFAH